MKPILFKKKNKNLYSRINANNIATVEWVNNMNENNLPSVIVLTRKILNNYFYPINYNYVKEFIYDTINKEFTCTYNIMFNNTYNILNTFENLKIFSDLFKVGYFIEIPNEYNKDYLILDLVTKIKDLSEKEIENIKILFKLYLD